MAELLEYSIAVMVSTLFVVASVTVYSSFTSFEAGLQLRAAFQSLSGLASQALEDGSAKATISVPGSTLTCVGGTLELSTGGSTMTQKLPVGCDFSVGVPAGTRTFAFSVADGLLHVSVG